MSSNTQTTSSVPYSFVIVKPRLNPRNIEKLVASGFVVNQRSLQRNEEIAQRHALEAKEVGRDGYRAGRTDAAGTRQADSGVPVFGWDGAKHEAITLAQIREDLVASGYVLVSANLVQKEGDPMGFLYLRFESATTGTPMVASASMSEAIDRVLAGTWQKMHVFRNPNGSATVNPSQALGQEQLASITERRALRMASDGSFANKQTDLPTHTPQPQRSPRQPPAGWVDPNRGNSANPRLKPTSRW